jgi:hypothetical protein
MDTGIVAVRVACPAYKAEAHVLIPKGLTARPRAAFELEI